MSNDPVTTEELTRRARELLRLGNSPQQIRLILRRLNVTVEQVNEAMAAIESQSRQRQKSDATYIWLLGGTAIMFFVVLMVGAYVVGSRPAAAPTPAPSGSAPSRPGPTNTIPIQALAQTLVPNIPLQLLPSLIPSDVPANFMLATPVVVSKPTGAAGVAREGCPTSDSDAANLFGGEPASWSYDRQNNGWTMTSVTKSVTINVPEGFAAGYLVLVNGPEMRSVNGPATLEGINFVALSCP